MKKFWMVWREGTTYMDKKHPTEMDANNEAKRLASVHPNSIFYVLAALKEYKGVVTVEEKEYYSGVKEDC